MALMTSTISGSRFRSMEPLRLKNPERRLHPLPAALRQQVLGPFLAQEAGHRGEVEGIVVGGSDRGLEDLRRACLLRLHVIGPENVGELEDEVLDALLDGVDLDGLDHVPGAGDESQGRRFVAVEDLAVDLQRVTRPLQTVAQRIPCGLLGSGEQALLRRGPETEERPAAVHCDDTPHLFLELQNVLPQTFAGGALGRDLSQDPVDDIRERLREFAAGGALDQDQGIVVAEFRQIAVTGEERRAKTRLSGVFRFKGGLYSRHMKAGEPRNVPVHVVVRFMRLRSGLEISCAAAPLLPAGASRRDRTDGATRQSEGQIVNLSNSSSSTPLITSGVCSRSTMRMSS
jgi:hypothetical protein